MPAPLGRPTLALIVFLAVGASACSAYASSDVAVVRPDQPRDSAPAAEPATTQTTDTVAPVATTLVASRSIIEPQGSPFAAWGEIVLLHPSDRVEAVAFHQSNHEGARELDIMDTAANPVVLESRARSSGLRSAVDVVIDPDLQVRAPVSGRVLRAGVFTLYCDLTDNFVVIEPHGHPGLELKVLHVADLLIAPGQDVVAGETPIATGPTQLPFRSQVDDHTAEPSWPHIHVELVDTSIPNVPNPNSGSEDC